MGQEVRWNGQPIPASVKDKDGLRDFEAALVVSRSCHCQAFFKLVKPELPPDYFPVQVYRCFRIEKRLTHKVLFFSMNVIDDQRPLSLIDFFVNSRLWVRAVPEKALVLRDIPRDKSEHLEPMSHPALDTDDASPSQSFTRARLPASTTHGESISISTSIAIAIAILERSRPWHQNRIHGHRVSSTSARRP